ncbi:MAG: molecular chaperone HtpG [Acetobacteraceae bacterium]|nr:molecular chaperone HtpG [Acetobacteraceae bacterium]
MANTERHEFSAEVGRLLDLVVHSLYSNREIFLRELVANAADAIDRRRFESLTDPFLALPEGAKIRIAPDKPARTLLVGDDGIGMTREEMVQNLGTIARSGTRAFGEQLVSAKPEERPALIGQFGVGFYSAFMAADRVEVISRRAGTEEAWRWASDGGGAFTMEPARRDTAGTDVLLHVKADAGEFLEPYVLETIVRKWADYITVPITIRRDGRDLPANEGTALWRKPRSEITEQQLTEFYRHLGHLLDTPWDTLHWRAEGTLEFYALLFIPGQRPFEPLELERKSRVRLHVRRMFITDEAELLPPFLRFVQGVVDTDDLPLNISREMLQATPVLARIRRAVTNRVLSELKAKAAEPEHYLKFWANFGATLKEGLWEDADYRAELVPLLRFRSSAQEGWTTLADYLARMQPGQDTIWYLVGDSEAALRGSPQLEGFRAKGTDVLLMPDPIDAFWPERVGEWEGKKLRSVTQAAEPPQADQEKVAPLLAALKQALGDRVSEVRATGRLTDSAVVLASGATGPDLQVQRLLRRSGRAMPAPAPILEVNPSHQLIQSLARKTEQASFRDSASVLLDLASIQDGDLPPDPGGFARRVTTLLGDGVDVTS